MDEKIIEIVDRLAAAIIHSLHQLFGFSYTRNTEHFVYQLSLDTGTSFTATTSMTGSVRISQESDFVCTRVNCTARYTANNTAALIGGQPTNVSINPTSGDVRDIPFTLEITDGSTDRQLQNEPVDAFGAFGNHGGLPGIWSKPRLFSRNANVSVKANCLRAAVNAADNLRLRILFIGWKIYDASSLDLTSRRA